MLERVTCEDIGFILNIVKWLIKLVQFGIPIILIVLVVFDLVKIVTAGSDDQTKKSTSAIVQRILWAVVAFFVPMLLSFIFQNISSGRGSDGLASPIDWINCFFN